MDSDRKLRVRKDGPRWGVAEYHGAYREWIFINREPFALKAEARDFLKDIDADRAIARDWECDRKEWARGLI